jgi:drug/metabolite transporter (DMT)-like permease
MRKAEGMHDNQRHDLAATSPSFVQRIVGRPRAVVSHRWERMDRLTRGATLVSAGSLTLVVMATLVKYLGSNHLPAMEILFFRSFVGLLFVLPLFAANPLEPFQTKRFGMHFTRGAIGAFGNMLFFWTITNLLLADAMALQFSRPLFMILLAAAFLGETVGWKRGTATMIGFAGILIMTRPFGLGGGPAMLDFGVLVGALGAFFGALVVVAIKQLSKTESTTVIMFYYAFWGAVFSLAPALLVWQTPTLPELGWLVLVGFFGIVGQTCITRGVSMADTTVVLPFDYLRIVYAAVFGFLMFGEVPGLWSLTGALVIVVSTLYILTLEAKRKPKKSAVP